MTKERLANAVAAVGVNKALRSCGSYDSSWLVGGPERGGVRRLQWEGLLGLFPAFPLWRTHTPHTTWA